MMKEILLCETCGIYTLKKFCSICKNKTVSPRPAKFSIEDKYLKYRLKAKQYGLRD
jgi:H/ACA ribonucleoprotein complex subunit 3